MGTLWPRCAVMGNSKTRGGVVEGLGVKRGISFLLFKIDDRRACLYADGDDPVKWKIDDKEREGVTEGTGPWENETEMCLRKHILVFVDGSHKIVGREGKEHSCRQVCIFAAEDERAPI